MTDECHQAQFIPGNEAFAPTRLLDKLFFFPWLQRQPGKTNLDRLKLASAHTSVATLPFCDVRLHCQYIIRLLYRKTQMTLRSDVIEIG